MPRCTEPRWPAPEPARPRRAWRRQGSASVSGHIVSTNGASAPASKSPAAFENVAANLSELKWPRKRAGFTLDLATAPRRLRRAGLRERTYDLTLARFDRPLSDADDDLHLDVLFDDRTVLAAACKPDGPAAVRPHNSGVNELTIGKVCLREKRSAIGSSGLPSWIEELSSNSHGVSFRFWDNKLRRLARPPASRWRIHPPLSESLQSVVYPCLGADTQHLPPDRKGSSSRRNR